MEQDKEALSPLTGLATTPTVRHLTPALGFIGAGSVAHALAPALAALGYRVPAIFSRSPASAAALATRIPECAAMPTAEAVLADTQIVFLTVPDDQIALLAAALPWRPGLAVVHCSGATPLPALAAARARGARIGALHPLLSISRAAAREDIPNRFQDCTFALNADPSLLPVLQILVTRLGGRALPLADEARVPYHIAAVLVSNYAVTLLQVAADLWHTFHENQEEALAGFIPLLRSVAGNAARLGISGALTGPIARGDVGTIQAHLAYLARQEVREQFPDLAAIADLYRQLGLLTIPLALEKGTIDDRQARELTALLSTCRQ
jgi:predicted short-subunit dehydrogenase-like oxidoreductase (DUF2520 family)